MMRLSLTEVVRRLAAHYGRPKPPPFTDPWHWVLWENVAYLADDERRLEAFNLLRRQTRLVPGRILDAPEESLLDVARHGILAEQRVDKLRACARLALEGFDGNLKPVLDWPLPKAKRALQKFPGIGAPGAEKILLFCRRQPVLALESNG